MLPRFDRRVVPDRVIGLVRAVQRRGPCELGGGAALSGAYLAHRLSQDVDLFFRQRENMRRMVQSLPTISAETAAKINLVRDAGDFVRAHVDIGDEKLEMDLVLEQLPPLTPPPAPLEGVVVRSLEDLRASKLT